MPHSEAGDTKAHSEAVGTQRRTVRLWGHKGLAGAVTPSAVLWAVAGVRGGCGLQPF